MVKLFQTNKLRYPGDNTLYDVQPFGRSRLHIPTHKLNENKTKDISLCFIVSYIIINILIKSVNHIVSDLELVSGPGL